MVSDYDRLAEMLQRQDAKWDVKFEMVRNDITNFRVELAKDVQRIGDSAEAAHVRVDNHKDEHKESRKWWAALWSGVILALVGSVIGYFKKGESK